MPYKNVLLIFLAEGFTVVSVAIAGLMAARLLPVARFGEFAAAFAFAQIMSVLVDSGMGALTAKKIAKHPSQAIGELNHIFTWRFYMTVAFSLLSPLLASCFLPTIQMREMAVILTPAIILLTTTDFVSWVFKGFQRVEWCVFLQVGSRTLLLTLCIGALLTRHPLVYLLAAYGTAGIAAAIFGLYVLAKTTCRIHLVKLPKSFFTEELPSLYKLGGIIILNVILSRMDVMLVARYCGSLQTGLYSGAARVMDGLRLMPTVALGICLPIFASVHDQPAKLRAKFLTAYTFLISISMAAALTGSTYADILFTRLLGPSYSGSIPLFRPLVWSCMLMYANMLIFALLYATNDHKTPAVAAVSAIGLNFIFNILLLPHYGPIAASWSRMAAEGCTFMIQIRSLVKARIVSPQDIILKPAMIIGGCLIILEILSKTPLSYEWTAPVGIALLVVTALCPHVAAIAHSSRA